MKCCVYTRAFNEDPYIHFFIEHYISIGFDQIIILKSDRIKIDLSKYNNYVKVYYVDNIENRLLPIHTNKINKQFDWVLCVDIDEILLLNNIDNIKQYINIRLKMNNSINIFYFRWAMLEKYDNQEIESFSDLISNYKIYENSHIKTMANVKHLKSVWHPHLVDLHKDLNIFFEGNIYKRNQPNKHKINKLSYTDAILLHIHTRSINNLVYKSFTTRLGYCGNDKIPKKIKDVNKLIILINEEFNNDFLQLFKQYIGLKASLPFTHSKNSTINIKNLGYKINEYQNNVINYNIEKTDIENILKQNTINIKEYYHKCNKIYEQVKLHFTNYQDNI